jgi:uroporphyrinogen-III synthase
MSPPEDLERRVAALEAQPGAPLPQLEAMNAAVAALEKSLAELKTAVGAAPAGAEVAALEQLRAEMLAELDRRIAALPAPDAAPLQALKDELAALREQLARLDRQQQELAAAPPPTAPAGEAATAALALAVVSLGNALRAGQPYAGEFAVVRELAAGDAALEPALAQLGARAETGIATLETLRQELAALAPAIAEAEGAAGEGVVDDLLAGLSGLVSVRPTGEVEGDSAAARVARAELRLSEGDLVAALGELQALEGEAAAAAQPWLQRAEAHQSALAALDQLSQQTLGRLAGN